MKPTHRIAQNVVSLYSGPSSAPEQISQLICGQEVVVTEEDGAFSRVVGEDRYPGWLHSQHLSPYVDLSDYPLTTVAVLIAEIHEQPDPRSRLFTRLTVSAAVVIDRFAPPLQNYIPVLLPTGKRGYIHEGYLNSTYEQNPETLSGITDVAPSAEAVVAHLRKKMGDIAVRFVGVPYLWGGVTPFGLDCSGFTQLVYKLCGVQLLRDSPQQYCDRRFTAVDEGNGLLKTEFAAGDLLFFASKLGIVHKISHVGLALGDGSFVHSAGRGRGNLITSCSDDEFGSTYAGARRLLANSDLSIDAA